ncbi:glycosyltransferase [Clostridium saccharoperbutylacetonicum]|uniref:glycosyltransferase n=1 Tax=Clostridium saccharoperbutylacetonicum TaxID=36745 RepID=UPI0039E926E4
MKKILPISLCMIVRNEEKCIFNCLESVKGLVNEIIIIDTGSTDKSKEICKNYTNKIFDFAWNENFSDARNFGIDKATSDWILWIDSDEILDIKNLELLFAELENKEKDIYLIQIINYYGDFPPDKYRANLFWTNRLFRNYKGFKFNGAIHEQLSPTNVEGICMEEFTDNIEIHHYGYMNNIIKEKKKSERNLSILEKQKIIYNNNPWIDFYIASEYCQLGKYYEAFEQVNLSIVGFIKKEQLPPSLLYRLKYHILITLENYDGARLGIEKAIELYPKYVDLHFYKGIILFKNEIYEEAISTFNNCLNLDEFQSQYLSLAGVESYRSWYLIGCCYEKLSRYEKAANAYNNALYINPNYIDGKIKLQNLAKTNFLL